MWWYYIERCARNVPLKDPQTIDNLNKKVYPGVKIRQCR